MFLNQVLKPYGLQSLGRVFAVAGIAGMIVPAVISIVKFFRTPGRAQKMKRANVLTSLLIASAILSFFCFLPLPFHVNCAIEAQPKDGKEVRTFVPGKIVKWNKRPGDTVRANEPIGELENIDLVIQLQKAIGEREMTLARYKLIDYLASRDPSLAAQVAEEQKALQTAIGTVNEIQNQYARLVIRSPIDGVICQPPDKAENKSAKVQQQLPSWSGSPFHEKNADAVFDEGELICIVAPSPELEGVLVVDQHDLGLLKVGDQVEVMFEAAKLESFYGKIRDFSEAEVKEISASLSTQAGGSLDTKTDETGRTLPMSTSYQAKVDFENLTIPLRGGYRGQANVHLAWKSLGWRLYRYVVKTFNFEF